MYSLTLWLRNTKVPVWTHESIGYPKMDISHWDAAIHYGVQVAQYCGQILFCNAISRRSPHLCSLALRLRNTKVLVWTHESIGYPKMDIRHWEAAIHNGIQLAQYCDQTRSCNDTLRWSPPLYSLALRLRNTKVPVKTHESKGLSEMDISQFLAFRPSEWEESKLLPVLCYRITLSIAVILSGNTLTTSVIVKTFNDICVSFISTSNIGLLVVVYPILLLW